MATKPKKPKADTLPPITEGDLIEGTNLRRRFQGGREICPRYVGPEIGQGERDDAARADCRRLGIRTYIDGRDTFMMFDGMWYLAFIGSTLNLRQ